jgi:hypothetical protein
MTEKKYICVLCNKPFSNQGNYWKHINKKTSCMPIEKCQKLLQENQMKESRLNYYQVKTKKLENKCKQLQVVVEKITNKDNSLKNSLQNLINEKLEMVTDKLEHIDDQIATKQNFNTAFNNCVINNNNNNNNLNFSVQLSESSKERLDHIKPQELLCILNHKNFSESLAHLIVAVFFHPKCPENWKWCVNDKKAKHGAIEYHHETNTLIASSTESVIIKNVQNVAFQMGDLLEELRMSCQLNINQVANYNRMYGLVGEDDIGKENIQRVKDVAHENRNFPKALWNQLNLSMSKNDYKHQIKMKSK